MMESDPESDEEDAPHATPADARDTAAAVMPIPTLTPARYEASPPPARDEASPPPSPRRKLAALELIADEQRAAAEDARRTQVSIERQLDDVEAELRKLHKARQVLNNALDAARNDAAHNELLAKATRREMQALRAQGPRGKKQRVQ